MRGTKIWLIISVALMVGGISLAAIGTANGGKLSGLKFSIRDFKITTGSDNYVTETYKQEPFTRLNVKTSTFDVNISKGNEYSVTYHVPEDRKPEITNKNGVLTIDAAQKESFTFFDFSWLGNDDNPYINITIPDTDNRLVFDIESSTGDVSVTGLSFEGPIITSTGDIKLSQDRMGRMKFEVSTGDIIANDCYLEELSTEASTGEVKLNGIICDGNYTAETSTGDITITDSEFNGFTVDGSTSDITVKNSKINTINIDVSTGEVELGLKGEASEYNSKIHTSTGDIYVNGNEFEKNYNNLSSGSKSFEINTSTGDIRVNFNK